MDSVREYPLPGTGVVRIVRDTNRGREYYIVDVLAHESGLTIAHPRSFYDLFNEKDWDHLARDVTRNNGHKVSDWQKHFAQVRIALLEELQGSPEAIEVVGSEDEPHIVPNFPESAWRGLFAAYRRIVGPTTEAPDVYHFFCFAITFGAALGRRINVYHAVPLFPNFFIALVGRTGVARKDTARARANKLLRELHTHDDPENPRFLLLPGIGSAEGLIESLGGDGKVVVAQEAELLSLMSKAKRDATSNLLPHLASLYDCPDLYTLKTRRKPVTCKNTFLSLLAGTTPTWLHRSMTEEHALGGFANRFMFVFGEPKSPIPFPPKADDTAWEGLTYQVNGVREWAEAQQQLDVTPEAVDRFSAWYAPYHTKVSGEGLLPALAVRFQSFAWKLALLYAAQERSPAIEVEHLDPALEIADWLWESNRAAFVNFIEKGRGLEDAILDRLAESRPQSKRSLYKAFHVSASELERATDPMVRIGLIRNVSWKTPSGQNIDGIDLL